VIATLPVAWITLRYGYESFMTHFFISALTMQYLWPHNGFRTQMNTSSPASAPALRDVAVLVGDVHASRKIDATERARLQERLRRVLGDLEGLLRRDGLVPGAPAPLATRLALTGGDEFQGVFREPAAVVVVVREVAERLHPHGVRFGLGRGPVTTPWADHPAEMDGPAFHRARAAVDAAKARRALLVARGFGDPWDDTLTALFHLDGAVRARWTKRQLEYVWAVRWHLPGPADVPPEDTSRDLLRILAAPAEAGGGRDPFRGAQRPAAERLGIAPATLSRGLRAAGFDAVTSAEHAAVRLLAAFTLAT